MCFVSITRLRIRQWRYVPGFAWFALRSAIQSKRADGNLSTSATRDRGLVFWTITVWRDEISMREFRNRGAHQRAMPKLRDWCDEATYLHWTQDAADPPTIAIAYERLMADGIVSKVKHPSPDHEQRNFAPPRE